MCITDVGYYWINYVQMFNFVLYYVTRIYSIDDVYYILIESFVRVLISFFLGGCGVRASIWVSTEVYLRWWRNAYITLKN